MNYREEVRRTVNKDFDSVLERLSTPDRLKLLNAAMGLAGESGEFSECVKKIIYHGHSLSDEYGKMLKELGDIRWYLELACDVLGLTIKDVEALNVEKLRARFPEGFSEEASRKRDLHEPGLPGL